MVSHGPPAGVRLRRLGIQTIRQLKELGFNTRQLDGFEMTDEATVQMVHLEECFPDGVAIVRKIECLAQSAMTRFRGAIADLSRKVPDLTFGVSQIASYLATTSASKTHHHRTAFDI